MKKKKKEVLSCRLTEENQWIATALEKKRKKEMRPSISNTIESILVTSLKQ